jgi:hypothetical protein
MPGHVSEVRWITASDAVQRRLGKLVEFLVLTESEYQELLGLWVYHEDLANNDVEVADDVGQEEEPQVDVDQLVADQLFQGTASPEELQMTRDLKAAMTEAHNMFTNGDIATIRKMT